MTENWQKYYETLPNYMFWETPQKDGSNLTAVYFSSHGWHNGANLDKQISNNYFEFKRNLIKNASRHIFIRDLFQSFYINGINSQICTVEKLLNFLKAECQNSKIVTVGSSGGGYMAILAGAFLQAEYVIALSGYLDIRPEFPKYNLQLLVDLEKEYKNKYYDLRNILAQNPVPVYQFEPGNCKDDLYNIKLSKAIPCVRLFETTSKLHAYPIDKEFIGHLINLPPQKMETVYKAVKNKKVSKFHLYFMLLSPMAIIKAYFLRFRKKFLKIKIKNGRPNIIFCGRQLIS